MSKRTGEGHPAFPYEIAEWKTATVQYNYHIFVGGMMYSVPHEYIHKKVDVRLTDNVVEIYFNNNRIASHARLRGSKGKYSTLKVHMPEDHQKYLEWDGQRFRKWAETIGEGTHTVIEAMLSRHLIEQQSYRSCLALLKLADKHSSESLEVACKTALALSSSPGYQVIKNILENAEAPSSSVLPKKKALGLTRGAAYFGRRKQQ